MIDRLTALGKALSDPTRVRILRLLAERPMCVCELMVVLGCNQPCVSQHLSILRHHHLVRSRREGKWMVCSADMKALSALLSDARSFFNAPLPRAGMKREARILASLSSRVLLCKRLKGKVK